MPAERQIWVGRKTNATRHPGKTQTYQYGTCKQAHLYCVWVFLPRSVSLYRQWISGVRTSFKLSHSVNTGPIDFFKQLMEAFRAGKLIKIICRSSSFKDSPLVYVELNHAWLENPSIGHCNWLVFLMAFQCACISENVSEFLWRISCCSSNNPKTASLKTVAVCSQSIISVHGDSDMFHTPPLNKKTCAVHAKADSLASTMFYI